MSGGGLAGWSCHNCYRLCNVLAAAVPKKGINIVLNTGYNAANGQWYKCDILPKVTPTYETALFSLKVPRLSPLVLLKDQY